MDSGQQIFPYTFAVTKLDRQTLHGHKSCILWFTGLSGSGKSTIANEVETILYNKGISTFILDGDHLRNGLTRGLGFSEQDREEHIRRAGEAAKLLMESGILVLATFISPSGKSREAIRKSVEKEEFIEIYVQCSLEKCEQRDPKGLYMKARKGEIREFTGISAPYDPPQNPDLVLDTEFYSPEACARQVIQLLSDYGYI
ncbi:adenylyl-sulfate kinase [Paenibacillus sp. Soil787]|uniref:adenylyl-sulfate kinase n=1 Tax=Paenibacillus sp. Soil787 TaxID=1736411 RepID=UPI000702B06B|nr:adenylyl-sulfate kinase [Paenibacillus sp. Soil787]KRF18675.1 adenylyl-sulfate kinase [Paenibacillus sp. Soil787]